jgi:DnaJ-class molecular chaperone
VAVADYYKALGVRRDATDDEIRAAFRRLAYLHPDLHPGDPTAATRFAEVTSAYATLSSPELRQRYDRLPTGTAGQVTDAVDFVTQVITDVQEMDGKQALRALDRVASAEGRRELRSVWSGIKSLFR